MRHVLPYFVIVDYFWSNIPTFKYFPKYIKYQIMQVHLWFKLARLLKLNHLFYIEDVATI
jgi:hypothetical protein